MRAFLLVALLLPSLAMAQSPLRGFEFLGCAGDARSEPTTVEREATGNAVRFLVQHEATCGMDVGNKPVFSRKGDTLTLDYALASSTDSVVMCDCLYKARFTFDASMQDVRAVEFEGARVAVLPVVPRSIRDARRLIARVHVAAASKDLSTLEDWMTKDFVSSFGGDGGISEALASWASDPAQFATLASITKAPDRCEAIADDQIQCPAGADTGWRAGFRETPEGWRFAWFVAGD